MILLPAGNRRHWLRMAGAGLLSASALPLRANTREPVVVLTSYPDEVVSRMEAAFEKAHPGYRMQVVWRMPHDALPYLQQPRQGGIDVYWSASPRTFAAAKAAGAWRPLDLPGEGLPGRIGKPPSATGRLLCGHRGGRVRLCRAPARAGPGRAACTAGLEGPGRSPVRRPRGTAHSGPGGFRAHHRGDRAAGPWLGCRLGTVERHRRQRPAHGPRRHLRQRRGRHGPLPGGHFHRLLRGRRSRHRRPRQPAGFRLSPPWGHQSRTDRTHGPIAQPRGGRAFAAFVLSEAGQRILVHPRIRKLPARPSVYAGLPGYYNPFAAADRGDYGYDGLQAQSRLALSSAVFQQMLVEDHITDCP